MAPEALLSALKSPALRHVFSHWSEVRGDRLMPGWGDIRPSRIAQQLPIVWSYTYDPVADTFTGRLAGDRIEAAFGASFRGTPLAKIFPAHRYDDVFQRAKRVISEPAVNRGEGVVYRQLERFGHGERIILPLAADGVHPDGLLGCTEYSSYPGQYDESLPQIEEWYPL